MRWDAGLYDSQHAFVWKRGEDVLDLLDPRPGEHVLDVGCGTGHLTALMAARGALPIGLDGSREMIVQARASHPHIPFVVADARSFLLDPKVDAAFSNAALHWMSPPAEVPSCVARALKPGGRFVLEMGGQGNVQAILTAVGEAMTARGLDTDARLGWYFPSLGEYTSLLEAQGFSVSAAWHFPRPTPLSGGGEGLRQWLKMFQGPLLHRVEGVEGFLQDVEERARPALWRNGEWIADYVRLRVVARRHG